MAVTKFHEKNVALFATIETTSGTYKAPVATEVIPATTLTGSVTTETESFQFLGDSLSRDETTFETDSFADVSVETLQPVLGTLDPALTVANAPLSAWYQSCGGNVTIDGTGVVTVANNVVNNSTISIDFRKTSAEDTVNDKLTKFFNVRGSMDVGVEIGKVPTLKFAMKGNANDPIQATILTPNFGSKTSLIAASVRKENIVFADIVEEGEVFTAQAALPGTVSSITKSGTTATVTMSVAHGLATGRKVNISGADNPLYNGNFIISVTSTTVFTYTMQATPAANALGTLVAKAGGYKKTFCFATLNAPNFFGFDYQRYITGCEEGFAKGAVPTDITVSMLEDIATKFTISSITFVTTTATVTAPKHGMTTGQYVEIKGATGADAATYNGIYIVTVTAANTFTYVMRATPAASATGDLIGVNTEQTNFDPDANISNFFTAQLKFGTATGKYVTYTWTKLQLASVAESKVATFFGREVTFRNTGKSSIILA